MSAKLREAEDRFILEWGRMSSSWGINRTVAQIHALLLVTGKPFTVDEIMARLHISRGNASMNLRDLIDWGIVKRFRKPADRKDFYQSNGDTWQMFAKVVSERKRREIDPTVAAIRDCLATVPTDGASDEDLAFHERLSTLLSIFGVIDVVYQQVFESDGAFRATVEMLEGATKN